MKSGSFASPGGAFCAMSEESQSGTPPMLEGAVPAAPVAPGGEAAACWGGGGSSGLKLLANDCKFIPAWFAAPSPALNASFALVAPCRLSHRLFENAWTSPPARAAAPTPCCQSWSFQSSSPALAWGGAVVLGDGGAPSAGGLAGGGAICGDG